MLTNNGKHEKRKQLRWFGHIKQRVDSHLVFHVINEDVPEVDHVRLC